jgi:uncharacterized protein YlxW (UPF0749 family)
MFAQLLFNKNTFIAIVVVSLVSFIYFRDLNQKNQIKDLSRTNEILNLSVQQYQKTLENVQTDIKKVKDANNELINLNRKLSDDKKELENVLFRERRGKKSLGQISVKGASKVEYRINKATKETFRCLEIITGDNYGNDEKTLYDDCINYVN